MQRSRYLGVPLGHLSLVLLAAGTLVRCDCEEVTQFIAGARYTPEIVDFGPVAVSAQKTVGIEVLSDGSKALQIGAALRHPADAIYEQKFLIAHAAQTAQGVRFQNGLDPELLSGLTPATTSSIVIIYRPCPDAWNDAGTPDDFSDDQVNLDYTFADCPGAIDQIELRIADNTRQGNQTIVLSGQPVQSPVMEIACPRGGGHCNEEDPELNDQCISLGFGNVTAGETPCDIVLEIRNKKRGGQPTGPLNVERLDLLVFDINDPVKALQNGSDIGFAILDMAGNPLAVDTANPLTVPIPEGADSGALKIKVRFNGAQNGTWRGESRNDSGLRVYSDDPDQRPLTVIPLTAIGSAPNIQAFPSALAYGPIPMGSAKTATVTVSNAGDATLRITGIDFSVSDDFAWTTNMGMPPFEIPPFANNSFLVYVTYSPADSGQDSSLLRIASNDINDNPLEIPLTGGAVPKIRVEPPDTLVFALPNPLPDPPIPPREESFVVRNEGFGDLTIDRLSIVGPGGDTSHPSVDDFTIMVCNGPSCAPGTSLCPPSLAGCMNSSTSFVVIYNNNDSSTTDLAELHIESNDPLNDDHILVLSAQDVPCFFPTPIITVDSNELKVGTEILVNARSSDAGGVPGSMGTLVDYQWAWLFTPGAPPTFTSQGTSGTSFTPTRHGSHVLGLTVTNSCGSSSQTPASENITIQP